MAALASAEAKETVAAGVVDGVRVYVYVHVLVMAVIERR